MNSKTIIISNNETGGRGILTLYIEDELLKCKLRLYNVPKLNRYCKLGVYHKDVVSSANFIEREGVYYSSLVGDFDLNLDFYCAVLDTEQNNKVILSGGTYAGFYFDDNSVFNKDSALEIDENEQPSEENNMEECLTPNCANCQYKKYFYDAENKQDNPHVISTQTEPDTQETNKIDENLQKNSIIDSILPQFDYIFNNFKENTELMSLIENSKFALIEDGNYSLGAIYENDKIKYICYAVKGSYNSAPPEELGQHYQWLPLDKEDPLTDGYYLVFQNADDLKIVEV